MAPSPLPRPSAEPSESSVLFSLSELMDLESERLLEEQRAQRERESAIKQTRELEKQRLQDEEAERARVAAEERRRADFQRREEEARLWAIARAELDKARLQMENEARLRLLAESQAHEQRLANIHEDQAKKKLRRLVALCLMTAVATAFGGYMRVRAAEQASAAKAAKMQLEAAERRHHLEQRIEELTNKMNRLGAAETDQRTELEQRLEILRKEQEGRAPEPKVPRPIPPLRPPRVLPPTPPSPPGCQEGDPMCPL